MRRLLIIFLAAGLFAVMGGVLLFKTRRQAPPVATFADGSQVEYLGSAVGGATFTTERPWERTLRRFLPARWLRFLPPVSRGSCSSGTNSVTFYFRRSNSTGGLDPWQYYAARDRHGFLYPPQGGSCSFGGGAAQILGLALRAYPRRQAEFDFEFLDGQGQTLARLRLPNPVRGPFKEWTPRPLPITLTNGPVALTLESLRMHTNTTWRWLDPNWRVQSDDPHWQHSRAGYATVSDATGNEGACSSFRESAWRLAAHVRRTNWEDFEPSEKLVLTNLTLPAPGQFVPLNASARITGVEVIVEALCGTGTYSITNNPTNGVTRGMEPWSAGVHGSSSYGSGVMEEHWGAAQPFLFVEVKGMQGADELRFRAFDEQDHEVSLEANGYQGRQGGSQARVYTPSFKTLTNGVVTRLEFVVSRPLDFEFLVNPAEVELGR